MNKKEEEEESDMKLKEEEKEVEEQEEEEEEEEEKLNSTEKMHGVFSRSVRSHCDLFLFYFAF